MVRKRFCGVARARAPAGWSPKFDGWFFDNLRIEKGGAEGDCPGVAAHRGVLPASRGAIRRRQGFQGTFEALAFATGDSPVANRRYGRLPVGATPKCKSGDGCGLSLTSSSARQSKLNQRSDVIPHTAWTRQTPSSPGFDGRRAGRVAPWAKAGDEVGGRVLRGGAQNYTRGRVCSPEIGGTGERRLKLAAAMNNQAT